MLYTVPDTAVFQIEGHTISSPIEEDSHGHLVVPATGEKLSKIMKISDNISFFRNGKEIAVFASEF